MLRLVRSSMSVSSGNGEESFSESALRANAFNMGRVLGEW